MTNKLGHIPCYIFFNYNLPNQAYEQYVSLSVECEMKNSLFFQVQAFKTGGVLILY